MVCEYFQGKAKLGKTVYDWESVFPRGITHSCERCGLCCTLVYLNSKDLKILKKDKLEDVVDYTNKDARFPHIKTRPNGFCKALTDEWLCSIYKSRPVACQTYPFVLNPGMDNNLIIDISLRCPYIGLFASQEILKKNIENSIVMTDKYLDETIRTSMKFRKTLADHLRVSYPPAFMSRKRRLKFMDMAIDVLVSLDNPKNMILIAEQWAQLISKETRLVMSKRGTDFIISDEFDKEIIPGISALSDLEYKPFKKRWELVFEELNNRVFYLDGSGIKFAKIVVGIRGVKINKEIYSWNEFEKLTYSKDALRELGDYLKINVRRAAFELTHARVSNYIVDYEKRDVIDFEMCSLIISRAIMRHIDPLSRLISVLVGHDSITSEDLRIAISNMDSALLTALMSGLLADDLIEKFRMGEFYK